MATVTFVGRLVSIPGVYGVLFEEHCTPVITKEIQPSRENSWQRSKVTEPHKLFWYDTDPITKDKVFVTLSGYGDYIIETLKSRNIEVNIEYRRDYGLGKPDFSRIKGVEWRPHQKEVVAKLLTSRGGYFVASTAFGKSFICKQICKLYPDAKIILTVPSKDIAEDLYEDLRDTIHDLGFCGDGEHNPQRVTVAISKSLKHCFKEANLVIVDECHAVLTTSYIKALNKFYRAKIFGFTASPDGKSDGSDSFMEAIFGKRLYEVPYKEAVAVGNVVQLRARLYQLHNSPELAGRVDALEDKYLVDRLGIITNKERNELIVNAIRELEANELDDEDQILVMVDKTEHAYILGQYLPEFKIVHGPIDQKRINQLLKNGAMLPSQEICTPKLRDKYKTEFENFSLKRVIATRVWEKGVDFRDLRALVRADGLASPMAANQIPGRLSRLGKKREKAYGIFIDIMDNWSRKLKSRSKTRLREYKKNGWDIELV
jgi:superfamily II DNA or RNA helicase